MAKRSRIASRSSSRLSEKDDHCCSLNSVSNEAFRYTQMRQYGLQKGNKSDLFMEYAAQTVPNIMQQKEYRLGKINKIFASQWLNDKHVVFGTKCNQLMVIDLTTGNMINIPSLKSSDNSIPADCPCGIHSIAVNPSKTLLATGARNTNDLAVYKLPTFDPVFVGENGHTDWIFDLVWVDDEFVVSGSRDSCIALWKVDSQDDEQTSRITDLFVPEYTAKKATVVKLCEKAQKVRALSINENRHELAALSLNAYFHLWDVQKFQQFYSKKLHCNKENVCMCVSKKKTLYAIGSQSAVTLIDPRSRNIASTIMSKHRERGIRSVNFNEEVITIGTGVGVILFYDLRAGKYLEMNCGHACSLTVGQGWLKHDENYRDFFMDQDYPNAIYTHTYDDSGLRLFAAGGPLPAGLWGNYAGLWY